MRKLKLFMAACALVGGVAVGWAQTDVTSTYLTNADFEGNHSSYTQPKSDRDIYQPEGWSVSYTNGNENDMTSLNSTTTQWKDNFSSKPQPANGGSKTYWMRFRWGSSENITLSQETSSALPAGTYYISVDAYSDDNTGTATISASGATQTVRTNGAWGNYKVVFTLSSPQKVTVSLSYSNTAADNQVAAFDNVKIYQLTEEPTGITLKNELGGTIANLSDFNVWYDDYTLEVEGTAGTGIIVAADNISYTPETTGTVRFVKKDGIVYVYEGTSYKGAVHSAKADYVYTTALTDGDNSTGNLLENGSFETLGDIIAEGKAWKLGEPWVIGGFSWPTSDTGTRVSASGGTHRFLWRGTGNKYFAQQVPSVKPYKGYKMYVRQVSGSNGFGDFRFGLGNAAGDISYLSANLILGSKKNTDYNKIHEAILGVSTEIPDGGAYFSCLAPISARNTDDNNTTYDPLSQIDWIGLVCSDDFPISGVSSASYIYGTAYAPATAKSAYLAAKEEAETIIADATYSNVTGEERAALQTAIDAEVEENDAAYNAATTNIENAISVFTSALSHYQALIDAQAAVPDLTYASTAAKAFITAVATSASDADARVAAMTTNIRALYESHAMAEGVSGAVDKTSLLTNPNNPANTTGWTVKNTTGDCKMRIMTDQPYTNANGSTATGYFDSNSWGAAFTSQFTQNVELPAGTYILTVKARGNGTTTYQVFADEQHTDITTMGGEGGVFGRGWNDYTVEFTLPAKKTVTLGINIVTGSSSNWVSFGNFRLVRIAFDAATSTEYDALNAAIEAKDDNMSSLGFEKGQYAPYNNVRVLTALANAQAIDQNSENAKADIEALTDELTASSWGDVNGTDVDAIYNGLFATVTEGANYPKGWTRTNNWGQMQSGLSGAYETAYYNQPGSLKYGNTGVYTMPLAANTVYKFTMAFRSHQDNSNNAMNVSVLNEENEGLARVNLGSNGSTSEWMTGTKYFKTGAAGNYVVTLENGGNTWMTGVSLTKATTNTITLNENDAVAPAHNFGDVTLTRTLSASNWNTFSVPFDMKKPDGWTVKEFDSAVDNVIYFKDATTIKAGMPYLVKPDADVENPTFEGVIVENTEGEKVGAGAYKFAAQIYNKSLPTDGTIAYLSTGGKVKKLTSGGIKGLRAYFIIPAGVSGARIAFLGDDDETTGISEMKQQNREEQVIYDLNGRRVKTMNKGIYVVNGKKIVK